MSTISDALQVGFDKYVRTIKATGYADPLTVKRLIVASWINKVLEGGYGFYANSEQYDLLNRLYMCVEGSCLVPYQRYCQEQSINITPVSTYIRITDESISTDRVTEQDDLRTV